MPPLTIQAVYATVPIQFSYKICNILAAPSIRSRLLLEGGFYHTKIRYNKIMHFLWHRKHYCFFIILHFIMNPLLWIKNTEKTYKESFLSRSRNPENQSSYLKMQNDISDPLDNLKIGNTKLVQMKDLIRTRYRYLITEHVFFSFLTPKMVYLKNFEHCYN